MSENKVYPVICLRGLNMLPDAVIHVDVVRPISLKAIEAAMSGDQVIFAVMQIDEEVEEPAREDLYDRGVICEIKQIVKLTNNVIRMVTKGVKKADIKEIVSTEPYFSATVKPVSDKDDIEDDEHRSAMLKYLKELLTEYEEKSKKLGREALRSVERSTDLSVLVNQICGFISMDPAERQGFL
ncbi:MAG: LON peptidase substrate-binding domain-containing protein, partial [Lachnospiraceae bacterium]|nr:LON peptidase substrate-binding domain-containing protein [Lachnospiraceae bacterium]